MTGSQASARVGYQKKRKVEKMIEVCEKCVGAMGEENQTIAMIRDGSYIDQEQDRPSTATPTFGILHSEGRSKKSRLGRVGAHTVKGNPPQSISQGCHV